ncbi:MAG: hypothetical protein ABJC39_05430, partial [Chloroflexota bacterium]
HNDRDRASVRAGQLKVTRKAPEDPLELFGRHRSPGDPAMLLYGCLDELAPTPFLETPPKIP